MNLTLNPPLPAWVKTIRPYQQIAVDQIVEAFDDDFQIGKAVLTFIERNRRVSIIE